MMVLTLLVLNCSNVYADATFAVLQQTVKQTVEHIERFQQMVKQVQLLQDQVLDTKGILELAQKAALGENGVEFISDFRNLVFETNDLIVQIQGYINGEHSLSEEWMSVFGSLDHWIEQSGEFFESIEMSDSINSRGYKIADSYQETYTQNAEYAQKLIDHAKTVNEKGALKQIAEEIGHLIEMENQSIYILSEMLRGQSVEYSNENLKRKEEIIKFERENEGVQRFMSMATNDALNL